MVTKVPVAAIVAQGATPTEAKDIQDKLAKTAELPKIDANELIERALRSTSQTYEEFFTAENVIIEDAIKEHGKDNAVLMFTAIHSHMSKVLFTLNRFRNVYFTQIEQMRKEVEDKAVKDLIQNHDFHYTPSDKKPKKIKTIGDKIANSNANQMEKLKESMGQLTDKDGKPIDMIAFVAKMKWGTSRKELEKKEEQDSYKAGLEKIKESITKKKED